MVPMLTCGLVRSNFAFATVTPSEWVTPYDVSGGVRPYGLLAPGLLDDLVRDAPGNFGVRVELHGVARSSLRPAPEIAYVTEHLGKRDNCLDEAGTGTLVHGLNVATARVEVPDHIAHELLGRRDFHRHHGLEQHGVSPTRRLLERHRTGDLEGELGRVNLVVSAVAERDLDVDHRIAGENAELHGLLAARVNRRDVLLGDSPTGDLVHELVATVIAPGGLEVDEDARVLPGAAGLLLVGVLDLLHLAADGLPVGHLRLADICLDPELAAHPVDQHLEVQLAHACDERLTGLLVGAYLEGGILLGEPLDRGRELLLVALAPWLDGHVDNRRWETHRLENDRCFRT